MSWVCLVLPVTGAGQSSDVLKLGVGVPAGAPIHSQEPGVPPAKPAPTPSATTTLLDQLRTVGLDPAQVYRVRELAIDREDLHIYLEDGAIAFTHEVNGKITGAIFEGEGEVLVRPPDQVERSSLGLFTGLGVLSERFTAAYLRFNDDTVGELRASLQALQEPASDFITKNEAVAKKLAEMDGLRLLSSFTSLPSMAGENGDHYLHARIMGARLGVFDMIYDSTRDDQISIGKLAERGTTSYYNIWMSFPARRARAMKDPLERVIDPWKSTLAVRVLDFKIRAELLPPQEIDAEAVLKMRVKNGGQRLLFFELSRYLRVSEVSVGGKVLEVIQNESLEGSELARRGNDEVAVVFPEPLKSGTELELKFKYRGQVMEQAGQGLLYVGSRGTWYPNRGLAMANFDLSFKWPSEWTLVASGKRVSLDRDGDKLVGRWVSEIPQPLAGFNLGVYSKKTARVGNTTVESYATSGMEYTFPKPAAPTPSSAESGIDETAVVGAPHSFNPSETGQSVADRSARAIEQYSKWFGPFPYSQLALTQFPGGESQSWPSLIFLSGTAFLPEESRARLKLDPFATLIYGDIMQVHETAHQWWGDLVTWRGYRDQWWVEALANYSALMLLEKERPAQFDLALERYRDDLLKASPTGKPYLEAGPVMLGLRLTSSEFPNGYVHISYGRGTWLIHMLRCMFRDASSLSASRLRPAMLRNDDELFLKVLRNVREKYEQKELTTAELIKAFEEQLPASLNFEGEKSLEWFIDGWLKGVAVPEIKLADAKITKVSSGTQASFTITQQNCPATLVTSVPVYAVAGDNRQTLVARVFADGEQSKFKLMVPAGTKRLLLDPNETILRRK